MKKGPANGKLFTGEDWNDEATLNESPYPYSKVCTAENQYLKMQGVMPAVSKLPATLEGCSCNT